MQSISPPADFTYGRIPAASSTPEQQEKSSPQNSNRVPSSKTRNTWCRGARRLLASTAQRSMRRSTLA